MTPQHESWDDIAGWWVDAVRDDPAQSDDTHGLLAELVVGTAGRTIDLGCGEGQGMRLVGGSAIGTDLSLDLLTHAAKAGPVVKSRLPALSWVRSSAFDRAISVGLIDLIGDHVTFFVEACRIVRPGGHLVVVINHPVVTAPGSAPLVDPEDEVLWRWGSYLTPGAFPQIVEEYTVDLHHRPIGDLLTAAAEAGWLLEQMIERGPSAATLARYPEMRGQEEIPTIVGCRWSTR